MAESYYLLLGAGDLAREVAALLKEQSQRDKETAHIAVYSDIPSAIAPCFDRTCSTVEEATALYPPGTWQTLCCVGDPALRESFYSRFSEAGYVFATLCHFNCTCYAAELSPGVIVFPGARIAVGTTLRPNILVNFNATVGHDCDLGAHSVVSPGAQLGGHVRSGKGALFGIGCSVLQGRAIGERAVIAAGSSVWMDVAPEATVIGVPAIARKIPGRTG